MAAGKRASNRCSGSSHIASIQYQVCNGRMSCQKGHDDGMGNIHFKYVEICESEPLKHMRCRLEGQLKSQGSEVCHIIPKEALDDYESRQFATPSNHFDHIDRCCGIIFTLHQAMAILSILNRPYCGYALFIDAKPQSQLAYWFSYKFDFKSMGMFGI